MTAWTCAECQAKNPANAEARFCRVCGTPRNTALAGNERREEFRPPWERPGWKDSTPEDRCTEPGCTLTVRDHIEEFRAITLRPGTVFTRPARVEIVSDHEAKIRAQAALLAQRDEIPF